MLLRKYLVGQEKSILIKLFKASYGLKGQTDGFGDGCSIITTYHKYKNIKNKQDVF
jgi:hypothetical protein